jgi:hypothetical protein
MMSTCSTESSSFPKGTKGGRTSLLGKDRLLGGEKLLFDEETELKGAEGILAALTTQELQEMNDCTMPIRYFRAEKVCLRDKCYIFTYKSPFQRLLLLSSRVMLSRQLNDFEVHCNGERILTSLN